MKKILITLLVTAILLGCCACGTNADATTSTNAEAGSSNVASAEVGIANPIHEATAEDMTLGLTAPEGATDISYTVIDAVGTSPAIEEIDFTLDGNTFCYRAQSTSCTALFEARDETASVNELTDDINGALEIGTTLCGIYEDWSAAARYSVLERDAIVGFNEGKSGFICWLDAVPGVMYCLSVDSNASMDLLVSTAEAVFVPVQGDS